MLYEKITKNKKFNPRVVFPQEIAFWAWLNSNILYAIYKKQSTTLTKNNCIGLTEEMHLKMTFK